MRANASITTTSSIEGHIIRKYCGVVTAHVVAGTGFFSDFAAGLTDIFGGRSGAYQKQLESLQIDVVAQLRHKAEQRGANWVIGSRINFDEISGKGVQMFMVSGSGTAVFVERASSSPLAQSALQGEITGSMVRSAMDRAELVAKAVASKLDLRDEATWEGLQLHGIVEAIHRFWPMPRRQYLGRVRGSKCLLSSALSLLKPYKQDFTHSLWKNRQASQRRLRPYSPYK